MRRGEEVYQGHNREVAKETKEAGGRETKQTETQGKSGPLISIGYRSFATSNPIRKCQRMVTKRRDQNEANLGTGVICGVAKLAGVVRARRRQNEVAQSSLQAAHQA